MTVFNEAPHAPCTCGLGVARKARDVATEAHAHAPGCHRGIGYHAWAIRQELAHAAMRWRPRVQVREFDGSITLVRPEAYR